MKRAGRAGKGLFIGAACAAVAALTAVAVGALMTSNGYRVLANLTPSIPQGFYIASTTKPEAFKRGDIVAFDPANDAQRYGYEQGWMKPGSRYMKRVAAVPGDVVCVDDRITIRTPSRPGNPATFRDVGPVAKADRHGVPLPHFLEGCSTVPAGMVLPIGDGVPNSYDGRYYGYIEVDSIGEIVRPLVTWRE